MSRLLIILTAAMFFSGCSLFKLQDQKTEADLLLDRCHKQLGRAVVLIDSLAVENDSLKQVIKQCQQLRNLKSRQRRF